MIFRKLTKQEEETHGIQCAIIRDDNKLQCTRKVQFYCEYNGNAEFLCGGHFQEIRQLAINGGEEVTDFDEPINKATDEIKPL